MIQFVLSPFAYLFKEKTLRERAEAVYSTAKTNFDSSRRLVLLLDMSMMVAKSGSAKVDG